MIAGGTLCDELRRVAETAGDAWAHSDEAVTATNAGAGNGWRSLTWSQVRQRALEVAAGFAALGLAPGERVALMLPNRSEHVLADLGAVHAGGLGVTLYATLAPEQIGYVAGDCDARIAVLDGAAELARWQPILEQLPGLTTIIVRDPVACPASDRYMTWDGLVALGRDRLAAEPGEISARVAAIKPGDPLALLYTSGTTGNPKGVLLTHQNICSRWRRPNGWVSSCRGSAGSPTCRWRTSPSGCSASTWLSAPSVMSISAQTPRSWCG